MFATSLGLSDFKASSGWLMRFKNRHNIHGAVCSGESGAVDLTACDDWKEKIPELVQGYEARDIYNMDETGVFFRALPRRTLTVKKEACKGGKQAKERITASLCVNMEGEFEKTVVIGKSAKPRCFKNVNMDTLPITYRAQKKAWMTSQLFLEWVTNFDKKMRMQRRKVILFLDNAPAHPPTLDDLTNVKVTYLMTFPIFVFSIMHLLITF